MSTAIDQAPQFGPSILQIVRDSCASIEAAWRADREKMNKAEADLADANNQIALKDMRLGDLMVEMGQVRKRENELLAENARQRAEIDSFGDISIDARDRLDKFAMRVARAQVATSSGSPELVPSQQPAAEIDRSINDARSERGLKPLGSENDPRDMPVFLEPRKPATARTTILPVVDFGNRPTANA